MSKRALLSRLVITLTVVGGALGALLVVEHFRHAGFGSPEVLVVIGLAIYVSWRWPILIFRDGQSQCHQLDEGFFVVLAVAAQPVGLLVAIGGAIVASQVALRRSPVKALFNLTSVLLGATLGIAVVHVLAPPGKSLSFATLGAAALGSIVYSLVTSGTVTLVMAALGVVRLRLFLDTMLAQALSIGTAVFLGCISALAVFRYHWAAPLLLLPFWAFRQTLAGSFQAQHDHARLRGLFDATLDIQRSVGEGAVAAAVCAEAARLLRCGTAELVDDPPPGGSMAAELIVRGNRQWLVVSGRSRTEPFDDADKGLLEALAVAAAAELENASLYEERSRQQEEIAAITASLGEGVCAFDASGDVSFINPAARKLLGLGAGELGPATRPLLARLAEPALRVISSSAPIHAERETFLRSDGTTLPVEFSCTPVRADGDLQGAVVTFRDISERLAFEEQLEFHAFRDALTGLPNRRVFLDRLEHALTRASRSGEVLAVFFIDVDRFKIVNDSLGHHAGDELLKAIAERLGALTRAEDTLARFGGDEFTLLIEGIYDLADAEAVAKRVVEVVPAPVELEGGRLVMTSVSVGVALAQGGASPDDVLHNADVAMYESKHRRGGQFTVFDHQAMGTRSAERVDLEAALRRAIKERSLTTYYQPLVSTESGKVVGAEALVRWRHPERGLLAPAEFIGLAEETGLVLDLGQQILDDACRLARQWQDRGEPEFTVSVNLSASQFQDAGLVSTVQKALIAHGLRPEHLSLEITESLAMQDIERSIATLTELKALGVCLAIDDFGTGYSSLTYLKRFPVDAVKLDRTFVQDLASSSVDAAIVVAVVDLARTLGLTTVAEGVETSDQLTRLAAMGCPLLQGYLLARPMPADEFWRLLDGQPRFEMAAS